MSTIIRRMVVGFLFNQNRDMVVLIRKEKPIWQRGRLNGIGGKVELAETPLAAIIREFQEEAGVSGAATYWLPAVYMGDGRTWEVTFFYAINQEAFIDARTRESEEVVKVRVVDLSCYATIYNLRWLIPFCLDESIVKPVCMTDWTS